MHSLSGPRGLASSLTDRKSSANLRSCSSSRSKLSSHVVAANAPSQGSTAPVSREDLIEHLRSGCKTRDRWRIGTEHEKLGFNLADNTRMDYEQINSVFERLQSRFGGEPMVEAGLTIGVKLDGQSVTLEPGGQFELSGAPLTTLHQTCAEVNSHLYQSKTIGEELGIGFLGVGFDPKWSIEQIPIMPKDRYRLMKSYMPTVGTRGLDMMFRTCTIQVNLDFESEQDMIDKFRIGLALQPIAMALFANSPFVEGKPTGLLSTRGDVWTDVDAARTGNLPFVFQPDMSFEKYVDYAMDVPMYFVYRNGQYINALGQSWRDFMEGKLPALPGERPTMGDWENHLTTIFPDVRLKRFLEMRGADGGPWRRICALPALWVGLLYDDTALAAADDLTADWTVEDVTAMRDAVPAQGLKASVAGRPLMEVAREVVELSRSGLKARARLNSEGQDESVFLNTLDEVLAKRTTLADDMLALYHGRWSGSVEPVFEEYQY
eukprot:GHRQ01003613.1.p1 GENE.GHRQ01003613.1~~GHRQ01003613.1.p1  ORF type:complete len:491 (+),score=78.50 GHRQ01003613.1:97-1569(+)